MVKNAWMMKAIFERFSVTRLYPLPDLPQSGRVFYEFRMFEKYAG